MPSLKNYIRLTMAMAFASLAAIVFSHLALTDIYHGEADTTVEWRVVQISFGILIAFIAVTVLTLRRVLESLRKQL